MDKTSKRIYEIFKELDINPSNKGYTYLKDAIQMCIKDETYANGITKRLYPDIAAKRDTTAARVERAIRHVITLMYEAGSHKTNIFIEIFGEKDKITNGTFIATFAEYMRYNS